MICIFQNIGVVSSGSCGFCLPHTLAHCSLPNNIIPFPLENPLPIPCLPGEAVNQVLHSQPTLQEWACDPGLAQP